MESDSAGTLDDADPSQASGGLFGKSGLCGIIQDAYHHQRRDVLNASSSSD
ncbi:hypothetical protein GbCGDNIH4_8201 [Granulibacter bethesdensis CGDNIH4]|nr:hypothetical protein GbCGDNIH4_8201 [Granulibacter bethesdensis CGDNIH4]